MDPENCRNDSESVAELFRQLEDKYNTAMIPSVVMLVVFSVVGLVGNVLVLVVYSKKMSLSSTKVLIMTIASFDLMANVGAIPCEIIIMMDTWRFSQPAFCKFKAFLTSFTTLGAAMSLFVVAIIRYRKVCCFQGWQVTTRNAKYVILITIPIAIICSIPYAILAGIKTRDTPCPNIKGYACFADDRYFHTIWPLMTNILFIVIFFVLSTTFVVLYVRITATVWKHRGHHNVTSDTSKSKTKTNCKRKTKLSVGETSKKGVHNGLPENQHGGFMQEIEQTSHQGAEGNLHLPCLCRQRGRAECEHNSQCSVVKKMYSSALRSASCEMISFKQISSEQINSESTSSEVTCTVATKLDTTSPEGSINLDPSSADSISDVTSPADSISDVTSPADSISDVTSPTDSTKSGATSSGASRLETRNLGPSKFDVIIPKTSKLDERNNEASILNEGSFDVSQLKATCLDETHLEVIQSEETNNSKAGVSEDKFAVTTFDHDNKEVSETKNITEESTSQLNSKKMDVNHEICIKYGLHEDKIVNSDTDKSINKKDSKLQKNRSAKQCKSVVKKVRPRRLSKTTIMLISISVIFILSYLPYLIMVIIKTRLPENYASLDSVELACYHLFYKLYFFNSAANPIIYSWCDINFRLKCIQLLKSKCRLL